jgi:hypothetical protein
VPWEWEVIRLLREYSFFSLCYPFYLKWLKSISGIHSQYGHEMQQPYGGQAMYATEQKPKQGMSAGKAGMLGAAGGLGAGMLLAGDDSDEETEREERAEQQEERGSGSGSSSSESGGDDGDYGGGDDE